MTASFTPAAIAPADLDEETARADTYGLLASLFYAPAEPAMLALVREAGGATDQGGFLDASWATLVGSAREMSDAAVRDEYDALFGGIGKPEVYLFGSHYLTGFLNEKPVVRLRDDLAALGLARDESMPETEDHFAYLCEVMRYLIAGDDVEVANLTRQREFFEQHIRPWAHAMCDAIGGHPRARFYAALAAFTHDFISVESQGFDMLV